MRTDSDAPITIVGHVTHDLYDGAVVAGGCAFYGARVYDRLGADVRLLTLVGEDFRRDDEIAHLEARIERRGSTTVFINEYPEGEPRVQKVDAVAPDIPVPDGDDLRDGVVHLAPVMGELDLVGWKRAASSARLLAINVQGWIKGPQPGQGRRRVVQRRWDVSVEELRGVDVACVSEEDLIGQGDLLERLREAIPIVALTHGAAGSRVFTDGGVVEVGAYPCREVDPTGAGDTYASSFVWRLMRGDDPVDAARFGAAAASIVVEGQGAEELERLSETWDRLEEVTARRA